jgi:hypothetical protein
MNAGLLDTSAERTSAVKLPDLGFSLTGRVRGRVMRSSHDTPRSPARAGARLVRPLTGILVVAISTLTMLSVSALPASASPPNDSLCAAVPSNGNCDGAPIQKYDTCWNYSYQVAYFDYFDQGWDIRTELRYSTICESNFAYTELIKVGNTVGYHLSNKIRRASGPDGGYLMYHAAWYTWFYFTPPGTDFLSPLVYAPDNAAEACLSNDTSDQIACTDYY